MSLLITIDRLMKLQSIIIILVFHDVLIAHAWMGSLKQFVIRVMEFCIHFERLWRQVSINTCHMSFLFTYV